MDQINNKEDLINYFKQGYKKENQLNIGVEHEKFIFNKNSNNRINFETVSKIFNFLEQFNWKPKITIEKGIEMLLEKIDN